MRHVDLNEAGYVKEKKTKNEENKGYTGAFLQPRRKLSA